MIKNHITFGKVFGVFLTSFLLGIIFCLYIQKNIVNEMGKTHKNISINESEKGYNLDLDNFFEVFSYIKKNYYSSDEINNKKIVESAIKGLVEGLGDKHSEFMTAEETKTFDEALSGDFEGIGAIVEKTSLGVKVDRILKGAPAGEYGVMKDDIIIEADGTDLTPLELYDAVNKIKGLNGTKVKLKILRSGEKNILEKEVVRGKIKIPSVDFKKIENTNLGYIALNIFGEDTENEFKKALDSLNNTSGIILDLRDNGGGYLQSAVGVLSNFIENGKPLVITKYREVFNNVAYKSLNDNQIYKGKIVVLINGNSASASEITAGALSDYKKAILVGNKSYGKGSVQEPFYFEDGSLLKLTIAKWFTPNNKNIDKEGITPDIIVDFTKDDYEKKYDRQLEVAQDVLQNFVKYGSFQLTIDTHKNSILKK